MADRPNMGFKGGYNSSDANSMLSELYPAIAKTAKMGLSNMWNGMDTTSKAATVAGLVPFYGDIAGVANDARLYAENPEMRTPVNFGLSALGLLPLIPSMGMVKGVGKGMAESIVPTAKRVAPQDEALRLAQERAALPVEQGGLGLPVDNTPEQRAVADGMGWNVDAYHGSGSPNIQKFMPNGGNSESQKTLDWYKDRQSRSQPVGYMSFRNGSFFSPKPEYANSYAAEGKGTLYPVKLKMDNPLYLLNKNGRYSVTNKPDINKTIDAMVLQDSADKSINEIAIIDPDQIRSRFAAFDPFRRSAAVAAAMGVAAPDLMADEKQKPAKKNIVPPVKKQGK